MKKKPKPKRKQKPKAKPVGRPTKFTPAMVEQVEKLCMLGATDKEIADFFGVQESTLNNWKIEFPEFLESIKSGKELADANVANSLYKRATGYEHQDTYFSQYEGSVSATPYTKHYPPDPTSMIFWLKNRRSKEWRDKQELEVTNKPPDLSKLSDEELKQLTEIYSKIG